MNKVNLYIALFLLLCTGCISEYNATAEGQQKGILVIEGTISGNTNVQFYVSRTVTMDTDSAFCPERDAEVRILCNDGTQSEKATEQTPGQYIVRTGALDANKQYCVQVKAGNETFQSKFTTPLFTPEIGTVAWKKESQKAPVDIYLSTHDTSNKTLYYMWTFVEDWEFSANYQTTQYAVKDKWDATYHTYEGDVNPYYYCWKQKVSTQIMLQSTEKLSESKVENFPLHTFPSTDERLSYLYCITVRQRALNKEAYTYYSDKQKLLEEMGSIFSPLPTELKGNIACTSNPSLPVIGFIDVAETVIKRLFIESEEAYIKTERDYCGLWSLGQLDIRYPADALNMNYRYVVLPGSTYGFWSHRECVECTATGTKNKPDFWPNNHQ